MKTKFPVTQKFVRNDDCLKFDYTLEILDLMGWNMEDWFFKRENTGKRIIKKYNNNEIDYNEELRDLKNFYLKFKKISRQ